MLRVSVSISRTKQKRGASGASDGKACASNRGPDIQWALDRLAKHIYHSTYLPDTANTLPESMQIFRVQYQCLRYGKHRWRSQIARRVRRKAWTPLLKIAAYTVEYQYT